MTKNTGVPVPHKIEMTQCLEGPGSSDSGCKPWMEGSPGNCCRDGWRRLYAASALKQRNLLNPPQKRNRGFFVGAGPAFVHELNEFVLERWIQFQSGYDRAAMWGCL